LSADHEHPLAGSESDSVFLELADQITERIQAGESVDAGEYFRRYPRWAGAIGRLLPTIHELVDYGRVIARERQPLQDNVNDADDQKP
jgi:hypothetical protein